MPSSLGGVTVLDFSSGSSSLSTCRVLGVELFTWGPSEYTSGRPFSLVDSKYSSSQKEMGGSYWYSCTAKMSLPPLSES